MVPNASLQTAGDFFTSSEYVAGTLSVSSEQQSLHLASRVAAEAVGCLTPCSPGVLIPGLLKGEHIEKMAALLAAEGEVIEATVRFVLNQRNRHLKPTIEAELATLKDLLIKGCENVEALTEDGPRVVVVAQGAGLAPLRLEAPPDLINPTTAVADLGLDDLRVLETPGGTLDTAVIHSQRFFIRIATDNAIAVDEFYRKLDVLRVVLVVIRTEFVVRTAIFT